MNKKTLSKKLVVEKLTFHFSKAFEELSGGKPSQKGKKIVKRGLKKFSKALYGYLKKLEKKNEKVTKALAKRESKALVRKKVKKTSPRNIANSTKKVPVN